MATISTSTQIDTINILPAADINQQAEDLLLLQRGITSLKLPYKDLRLPIAQLRPITNGTLVGNASGGASNPQEITIDEDLDQVFTQHNSIPSSLAIQELLFEDSVDGTGDMHYVNVYAQAQSATDGGPSAAAIAQAKLIVGGTVAHKDNVMVCFRQKYSYYAGNGTAHSQRVAYYVYLVTNEYTGPGSQVWTGDSGIWL
jgi:hypothetical protein